MRHGSDPIGPTGITFLVLYSHSETAETAGAAGIVFCRAWLRVFCSDMDLARAPRCVVVGMYVCRDDNDVVFFIQQIGGGSLLSPGCVGGLFLLVRDVNHTIRYIRGVRRSLRRRGYVGAGVCLCEFVCCGE